MIRVVLALVLAVWATAAAAQSRYQPAPGCSIAGCTFLGPVTFGGNGATTAPLGSSAQRPDSGGAGEFRFNTDTGRWEFGTGSGWMNHVNLGGDTMTGPLTVPALTSSGLATLSAGLSLTGNIIGAPAFSVAPSFNAATNSMIIGNGAGTSDYSILLTAASGHQNILRLNKGGLASWQVLNSNDPMVTGFNVGALLNLAAYTDSGAFNGPALQATRGSGPLGLGPPAITAIAPWHIGGALSTIPGGILAYSTLMSDVQPTVTLGASPISTTNGSATVKVTWTNCCGATSGYANGGVGGTQAPGPLNLATGYEIWVQITGATAVGGLTLNGWFPVVANIDANTFTVACTITLCGGTGLATSTATGGGSAVHATPSFPTQGTYYNLNVTTPSNFFTVGHSEYVSFNPVAFHTTGGGANYQHTFSWVEGPSTTDPTSRFTVTYNEIDLTARGPEIGYYSDLSGANQTSIGLWMGAKNIPPWAPAGGTPSSWDTALGIFWNGGNYGVYDGLNIQPDALTPALIDPTGHGGVGIDVYGGYANLNNPPFTVGTTGNTVTVNVKVGITVAQIGDCIYLPNQVTISGITFGGPNGSCADGGYAVTAVDAQDVQIAGSGSNTGAGGSPTNPGQWLYWEKLTPYAPHQIWGRFLHGIVFNNSQFVDGMAIRMQPGQGLGWYDGTSTASITGTELSPGNINVTLTPSGTGAVAIAGGLKLRRRSILSGSTDSLGASDVAVFWKSASGAAKAQTIPNCTSATDQTFYRVGDEQGDAGTNNITIAPTSAGTIGGGPNYKINSNYGSVDLMCDGPATNWVPG